MNRAMAVLVISCVVVSSCEEDPGQALTAPPPGAQYLPIDFASPESILMAGGAPAEREEFLDSIHGLWVPAPGWSGVVESVTSEEGGTGIRIYEYTAGVIGGGYWIVAVVPGAPAGIGKGDQVTVQGWIDSVGMVPGTAERRIVLRDGILLSHRPRSGN